MLASVDYLFSFSLRSSWYLVCWMIFYWSIVSLYYVMRRWSLFNPVTTGFLWHYPLRLPLGASGNSGSPQDFHWLELEEGMCGPNTAGPWWSPDFPLSLLWHQPIGECFTARWEWKSRLPTLPSLTPLWRGIGLQITAFGGVDVSGIAAFFLSFSLSFLWSVWLE